MDSHRKIEQIAADWLARRSDSGGTWTQHDQDALDVWLSASPAHQVAYIRLEAVWRQADRIKVLGAGVPPRLVPAKSQWRQSPFFVHRLHRRIGMPAATDAPVSPAPSSSASNALSLAALQFRPRREPPRRRGLRLAGAVASMVLVTALSLGGWQWYAGPTEQFALQTALGDMREVVLSDGSSVTLSSNTHLQVVMSRRARRIELQQGEAYFEVARDASRPFTVQAGDTRAIAVGTRYAVRSATEGMEPGTSHSARVVVTEGTVRLEPGDDSKPSSPPALLTAGVVATVRNGTIRVEQRSLEHAEAILGWRTGEVIFSGTPLAEAAAEFNRYNKRRIVIEDPALARVRIDGGFRTDNIDGFVRLLEVGFEVRAERKEDRIVLRRH